MLDIEGIQLPSVIRDQRKSVKLEIRSEQIEATITTESYEKTSHLNYSSAVRMSRSSRFYRQMTSRSCPFNESYSAFEVLKLAKASLVVQTVVTNTQRETSNLKKFYQS